MIRVTLFCPAAIILLIGSAQAQTATSQAAALDGLVPLAQIPTGPTGNQGFWDANRNQTSDIANGTSNIPFLVPFAAGSNNGGLTEQGLSILDAPYTRPNLNQLADGFGSRLGPIYQGIATWSNPDPYEYQNATWSAVSRNVTDIIQFTGAWIRDDNQYARRLIANGNLALYPGAVSNPYGNAYNYPNPGPDLQVPDGSEAGINGNPVVPGNDRGNPRPFQTLPISNQSIPLFWGPNFNTGQNTSNWQYLAGPINEQNNSTSYASGHAAYGIYGGLLLGMLVPERFTEMNTRGIENALGRVVLGAHWATDMIGSRTLAYYDMAQMFAGIDGYYGTARRPIEPGNPEGGSGQQVTVRGPNQTGTALTYQELFQAAYSDMRTSLSAACGTSITECVQGDTSRFNDNANNRAFYEANLTLGLPTIYADQAAIRYDFKSDSITRNAGHLLQTRFPYLSLDQRADVISSTQYMPAAGNFLDNGSAFGRFSRIDLAAAADGYASFDSDVSITMDASKGSENPYWAEDSWSNNIGGAGGFTKNGTGVMRFTGINNYAGPTLVNGGALLVDGSITSRVTVNSGGLLGGRGSFGGGTIASGAFLAPGNSIGTITSNGNLIFASGSTYVVEVDAAGHSDKTVVNGSATLQGGTVAVSGSLPSTPLALSKTKYTILTATNGITGNFSGVTGLRTFSFLTGGLTYGPNDLTLGYAFATPFSVVGKNINQRNVGNSLTLAALGPVNALGAPILNALFLGNYQNAQAVMDTVSGSGLAGVQSTAMQVGEMASSTVSDQIAFWRSGETYDATGVNSQEGNNPHSYLAYAPVETSVKGKGPINIKGPSEMMAHAAPRTYRAWGSMFGGGANFLSDAGRGSAASNLGYYGGLVGVDYQVQPNLLIGAALGGSTANFNVGSLSTNGALTGFHAGLYGSYTLGASYVALNETFSAYNNQTTRKAGGYALMPYEQLSAGFGSTEFRTRLEGGHTLLMGGLKATPFVAAEIAAYQSSFFAEKSTIVASTFALKNNGQSVNSLPTFVGLRLSNGYMLANGWRLAPIGSVAYVHEFFPQRQFTNILMSMPGADFNVSGPRSTYNLVQTKLGAQLNLTNQFALFSDFQGEFSPMSQSYGGTAGMKYWW